MENYAELRAAVSDIADVWPGVELDVTGGQEAGCMLQDGHLTNAGVLLFAKNPTQFMPCARVRVSPARATW